MIRKLWRKIGGKRNRRQPDFGNASFSELQDYLEAERLTGDLNDTVGRIREAFGNSPDLTYRQMSLGVNPRVQILLIHLDGMVDTIFLTEGVLRPILEETSPHSFGDEEPEGEIAYQLLKQRLIQISAVQEADRFEKVLEYIGRGYAVLFVQGVPRGLACEVRGWAERDISEPGTP